jgi:2-C-methyl-D-erythritol 4-phosphate cytidylyltransferase
MKKYVIIVAGGKGERMNTSIPKQFIPISGKPILMHTIQKFHQYDHSINIILVLPENQYKYWEDLCKKFDFNLPHKVVFGGETRFHSVSNGLKIINDSGLVAIHDGVRPFVSIETLERCYLEAEMNGNAIPCIEIVDSIRLIENNSSKAVDRSAYRLIQTPQVFKTELIKRGFEQNYSPKFTDDASVIEAIGEKINLVEGNKENVKITTPYDLALAEKYLTTLPL